MGKVINLNKYRKRRAKLEREKQADVNRRLHGRTAAERAREEQSKQRLTRAVDGSKLERPGLEGDLDRGTQSGPDEDAPEPSGG